MALVLLDSDEDGVVIRLKAVRDVAGDLTKGKRISRNVWEVGE